MPEQELNLLQLATRRMAEPGTCPPEVVRREPVNARFTGVLPNDVPDRFFREAVTPGAPVFVYPTEQLSGGQIRSLKPLIEESFDPAGIGTVLVWPALPFKSTMAQCSSRCWMWLKSRFTVSCRRRPQASRTASSARSRLPFNNRQSGVFQSRWDCSGVSQFPSRTPIFLTPFTRRIPAAKSGLSRPQSEAS